MTNYILIPKIFHHVVLEGTSYEIGLQFAEIVINEIPNAKNFITSGTSNHEKLGFRDFKNVQSFIEDYCSGINDEIQGLADGLSVDVKKINFYDWTLLGPPNFFGCTHFSVLGNATADNHTLSGRSYEWDAEHEDFVLYTTRIKGKMNHIGFSELIFGRTEGLNEYGLGVTMSNGGIFEKKLENNTGIMFWLVVRSILENCRSVEKAAMFIEDIPILGFFNFLITDSEKIMLVECADGVKGIKIIDDDSQEFHLSATNSFTIPETTRFNKFNIPLRINGSKFRREIVEKQLKVDYPKISKETIRGILSLALPKGVCAHWYSTGFGTDWSLIFDHTEPQVEVCFGAPSHNKWIMLGFDDPIGIKKYNAILPDIQE